MAFAQDNLVMVATPALSPLELCRQPVRGRIDSAAPGPFAVLWETGTRATGVEVGSIREINPAGAGETERTPANRVFRMRNALGLTQIAQEALVLVGGSLRLEDDAGAQEAFCFIAPVTRDGSVDFGPDSTYLVQLGTAGAPAQAALEALFGPPPNFPGGRWLAQPGAKYPRY